MLYEIHISNRGKAEADITYQFRFTTKIRNQNTFLYNTGPITSITDATWNRPQFYSVTRVESGASLLNMLGERPAVPAGQRRRPQHAELRRAGAQAVHNLAGRAEGLRRSARRRASSSTSAASSISARCGRSRTCT